MSLSMLNNQFSIEDKVVLTKTANNLIIDANQQIFTDIVSINARLNTILSGSSPMPYPMGGDVFYDSFSLTGSSLPGTGSLETKVVNYVCETWNLTLK